MNSKQLKRVAHTSRKQKGPKPPAKTAVPLEHRPSKAEPLPLSAPHRVLATLRGGWSILAGAAVLATLGAFAYQIRPNVSIDVDIALDASEPFSHRFKIANVGGVSLHNVKFACTINNPNLKDVLITGFPGQSQEDILEPGDVATKSCPGINAVGERSALRFGSTAYAANSDIVFFVSGRPSWFWAQREWQARFVNVRDFEGKPKWVRQPARMSN
jgi:hypothetical protein